MKFKLIVGGSYLLCVIIIGAALFSTPYMMSSLHNGTVEGPIEMLGAYLFCSLFVGLPWLLIYYLPLDCNNGKISFSIGSILLSALFYKPISDGHDFGIGLSIIFYILTIFILSSFSKSIR